MTKDAVLGILSVAVARAGDTAVVRCQGRMVGNASEVLHQTAKPLLGAVKHLQIDLGEVTRLDSMGLSALVRLYVSAKSSGSTLELVHLGPRIRELLGITHLLDVFTIIGESGISARF